MLPPSVGITTTHKLPRKLRQQRQRQKAQAAHEAKTDIEAYIEREVKRRTAAIEAEARRKIERLHLAYDLHVNSEIERYLETYVAGSPRASDVKKKRKSNVLSQLFAKHEADEPRQISDLDRFRAYLRGKSVRLAADLRHADEALATATDPTVSELIETIEKLRVLVLKQDEQLEQAQYLLQIALAKVESSDDIVLGLDHELGCMENRLERASTQVQVLRRSQRATHRVGTV
ncbi:hypothetical protein SPRG_08319 [Saprolegnia parasitica CBS 223.65]|uniref:Uncharacterized protein n=1 Tax=Saprolegnia parasitica (strain CBS 223.65) TaxID=695850 RepID=A0A067C670_SAPPC|nr:hypothetical protein SPRG_08319 [Saprolegnia parasitica CBS 223.65]KDO26244.1 hypothetical protein SPRG_08319 [Saprolegnia parasitica CBS 223.65]|eukprot:XP_012202953.1 hypothetical protein SPRG_08319 [Saprolegnia parasitica CBS 223.65]